MPNFITVCSPISCISSSKSLVVFLTTSSMRDGCILPSIIKAFKDNLAISLLIGSKLEIIILSGVSSIIISTPVVASRALIFLPSLPIILPFSSSLSRNECRYRVLYSTLCGCSLYSTDD